MEKIINPFDSAVASILEMRKFNHSKFFLMEKILYLCKIENKESINIDLILFIENIIEAMLAFNASDPKIDNLESIAKQNLINLDFKLLTPNGWLKLYDLCHTFGLFGLLGELRRKTYDRLDAHALDSFDLRKKSAETIQLLLLKIGASIERGNMNQARFEIIAIDRYLSKFNGLNIRRRHIPAISAYLLQSGDRSIINELNLYSDRVDLNDALRDLITNQSIAVVGPATTDEISGAEIDAYDIIIRPNYRLSYNAEFNIYGSRTDITYYNRFTATNISDEENIEIHNKIKHIVYSRNPNLNIHQRKSIKEGIASYTEGLPFLMNGFGNLIQVILTDILRYNPAKVKVFKTDFFISKHHSEYKNKILSKKEVRLSAKHDLWSQVTLVRNLVASGAVCADDSCQKIISMDVDEYFLRLGYKFGRNTLFD